MYKASEELPLNVQQRLVSEDQTWRLPSASTLQLKKYRKSLFLRLATQGVVIVGRSLRFKQLLLSGSHIL